MRLGYRNPYNAQLSGQGLGRPGLMVWGVRPKLSEEKLEVYGDPKLNTAIQRRLAAQDNGTRSTADALGRRQLLEKPTQLPQRKRAAVLRGSHLLEAMRLVDH